MCASAREVARLAGDMRGRRSEVGAVATAAKRDGEGRERGERGVTEAMLLR